jgi:uncharacterized protein YbaR (Trm112 family)
VNNALKVKMKKDIFCPLCKDKLVMKDGYLFCPKGNCGFSKMVQDAITKAVFNEEAHFNIKEAIDLESFFCPGCRNKLSQDQEHKIAFCKKCKAYFPSNIIYHLIEHTGHPSTDL